MAQFPAAKIRLMLVDDHEVVRLGLRTIFSESAYIDVVAEATSVAEAISHASGTHPDVILMDMRLPDGTGLEACREIRSGNPSARVLFLTSYSDADAIMATILAGAAGYLLKEIRHDSLVDAVIRVAGGESIVDPALTEATLREVEGLMNNLDRAKGDLVALSAQERRILALVVKGKTNKEIAIELGLSSKTVKNYLHSAFQKLNVHRRAQAAIVYSRLREETAQGRKSTELRAPILGT